MEQQQPDNNNTLMEEAEEQSHQNEEASADEKNNNEASAKSSSSHNNQQQNEERSNEVEDEQQEEEMAEQSEARSIRIIDDNEEEEGGDEYQGEYQQTGRGKRGARKKGFLKEDLAGMMKGFGEAGDPRDDTLELMECYVYEFINNLVHRSLARSQRAGFAQIQMRDLLKVIEGDEKKFLRVPYVLTGKVFNDKFNRLNKKQ